MCRAALMLITLSSMQPHIRSRPAISAIRAIVRAEERPPHFISLILKMPQSWGLPGQCDGIVLVLQAFVGRQATPVGLGKVDQLAEDLDRDRLFHQFQVQSVDQGQNSIVCSRV